MGFGKQEKHVMMDLMMESMAVLQDALQGLFLDLNVQVVVHLVLIIALTIILLTFIRLHQLW